MTNKRTQRQGQSNGNDKRGSLRDDKQKGRNDNGKSNGNDNRDPYGMRNKGLNDNGSRKYDHESGGESGARV